MDKYLNKDAVELKLNEIKAKYIDCIDFLNGWDSFVATLEVEAGSIEAFEKLLSGNENKKSQVEKIFKDLPSKYDYFSLLIEKDVLENEVDGIRLQLLDKNVLENKVMELELKYVEALGFNFSYDVIVSYNDKEKDGENLKNLADSKKKNDIALEDIKNKIDLFKKLLSLI